MRQIIDSTKYNYSAKKDAFGYQHEAFLALKDKTYAAIFHEQGLGKTKIAIDLLLYWLQFKSIDTVMVVTKKQLVKNWIDEFEFHTNLRPHVLSSDKGGNYYILNGISRVIVTNFETISGEKERLKLFLDTRNVAIIIDESAKIKNPESKLTKDFFDLAPLFKIKLIMTGTPVANRPYDIWAQIYFLDHGMSLGEDFKSFKNSCDLANDLGSNEEHRSQFENSVSGIFERIKDFSVRETKNSGIIKLPNKEYHTLFAEFGERQKAMYNQIKDEMRVHMIKNEREWEDESPDAIKRLLRLVQAASNPKLLNESYNEISAKESILDKTIKEILERGEKVIVWSIFTENIDYFCRKYVNEKSVKITGKMAITERNKSVDEFKKGDAMILFATPQSAKEGLTLTVANNAIFYDRGFNLDDYLQAQDRIHRISQTKDCRIYNIIVNDSIDEWIDVLIQAKQNAAFLAQGDIKLKEYQKVADYSFGELVHNILN